MSDCAICGGTGFEIVVKDDREFARTCVCRASGAKGPDVFERLRVPARYRGCTLANFESASSPQMRAAWEKAASFAAGYPAHRRVRRPRPSLHRLERHREDASGRGGAARTGRDQEGARASSGTSTN